MYSVIRCSLLLPVLLSAGLSGPTAALAVCAAEEPEGILRCLETAYGARDSAALADLYAEDFVFVYRDESTSWGRTEELQSAGALFANAESVRLKFPGGWRVTAGEKPDTWVLQDVRADLSIEVLVNGEPKSLSVKSGGTHTFWIRRVADPARLVICRWLETPPDE